MARDGQAVVALFADLVRERDFPALTAAISRRQQTNGDAIQIFRETILPFILQGEHHALRWLDAQMPADTALKFYTQCAMAYVAGWAGDVDETSRRLREAVKLGLAGQRVLATDAVFLQYLVGAAQQAVFIDHTEPLRFDPIRELPQPTHAPDAGALTVLASCNGRYFDRFGDGFIASARKCLPRAGVHIHISNPSDESRRLMQDHGGGSVTFSSDLTPDVASLFACKRFLLAPIVMRERRSDLLISDIDVNFTDDAAALLARLADHDGGWFERATGAPMEICSCSFAYFRYTKNAAQFLSILARYIESKLNTDNPRMWTLDQCALFLVSRRAAKGQPAGAWDSGGLFSLGDLSIITGRDLSAAQVHQDADLDAKYKLRNWPRDWPVSVAQNPDGSVSVQW